LAGNFKRNGAVFGLTVYNEGQMNCAPKVRVVRFKVLVAQVFNFSFRVYKAIRFSIAEFLFCGGFGLVGGSVASVSEEVLLRNGLILL
jgi:hypothetical protein